MKIINKKTKERFEIVCTTGLYVFLANLKTKEIIAVGDLSFARNYEVE